MFLSGFLGCLSLEASTTKVSANVVTYPSTAVEIIAGVPLTSQDQGEPESTMSGTTRSGFTAYGEFLI